MDEYTRAQIERMMSWTKQEYEEHCLACHVCREDARCCETGYAIMEQNIKWMVRHMRGVNQEVK